MARRNAKRSYQNKLALTSYFRDSLIFVSADSSTDNTESVVYLGPTATKLELNRINNSETFIALKKTYISIQAAIVHFGPDFMFLVSVCVQEISLKP